MIHGNVVTGLSYICIVLNNKTFQVVLCCWSHYWLLLSPLHATQILMQSEEGTRSYDKFSVCCDDIEKFESI